MALPSFAFLSFLILSLLAAQPQQLRLKQSQELILAAGESRIFTLTVPPEIQLKQELYINAEPTIPDPFQQPYLTINSSGQYQENCYYAHSSFASYCKISEKELKPGREFHIKLTCVADCRLNLVTELSDKLRLGLGQEMRFTALEASGLIAVVSIPYTQNDSFSALTISALITNLEASMEQNREGVEMYIYIGENEAYVPHQQKFTIQGHQLYSGGRIAFLERQKIPKSGTILVLLKLKKWISVVLSASKQQGDFLSLVLGRNYYEMVKKDESMTYLVDNSNTAKEIRGKTIEFVFDIFAGKLQIVLGFDDKFTKNITLSNKYSAVSLQITPQLRRIKQYNGSIYIKVTAEEHSEFYFYSQLTREDATYLKPYTAFFDQLEKDDIYNYIFDERFAIPPNFSGKKLIREYTFKADMSAGKGRFLFTRCKSLEIASASTGLDKCLKDPKDLMNIEFIQQEIQVKTVQSGSLTTINLQYDILNCPAINSRINQKNQTVEYRQCVFQIIAQSLSQEPWLYTLYAQRRYHLNYLKENKMVKEYLTKETYANFAFALPDYDQIQEINIFSVTFSGKSVLLVSQEDKFPTLYSDSREVKTDTGSKSSITLKANDLKEGQVYISVYAQTFTEVNVGVTVHRKSGKPKEITLEKDNAFPYTFGQHQSQVKFRFVVKSPSRVSLSLNELVGLATMQVFYQSGKTLNCIRQKTNRSICRFQTRSPEQLIYAVVRSQQGRNSQFTITYSDLNQGRCKSGMLNHPTFVELISMTVECFVFNANRPISMRYVDSINNYILARKDVKVQYAIDDRNFTEVRNSTQIITVREMIKACPLGRKTLKNEFLSTCSIKVRFSSQTSTNKSFSFLLQEQDKQLALFDGITNMVNDVYVYGRESQYFYFKITSIKAIKIFISSDDVAADFFLIAKVVDSDQFIKRTDDQKIYPKFIEFLQRGDAEKGLFFTDLGKTATAVISISDSHLKSLSCYAQQCYLLISVTPEPASVQSEDNRAKRTAYELEITQTQTTLQLGDTKTGFVSGENTDRYIITPEDGLISLRNLQNQDIRNGACARIMGSQAVGGFTKFENIIGGSYIQLKKSEQIQHIIVRATQTSCSYQISYERLSAQVHSVKLAQPYTLKLETGQSMAFVYYHNSDVSFKIVKSISAGKLVAYLTPLKDNVTLTNALNIPRETYEIVDEGDRQHFIEQSSPYFCFDCIYLMTVSAPARFVGEIVFLRASDPIPLSTNHALKEWLLPNSEWEKETYIYYSVSDFDLTFEVITGKVVVLIKDPTGKVLFQDELTQKKRYVVKADYKDKDVEYFSKHTQFEIHATAATQTEFYIKVDKNRINERIFQGLPASFNLTAAIPLALQFVNSEQEGGNISFMLEIKNEADSNLNFTVTVEDYKGNVIDDQKKLVLNKVQAESTYILNLLSTNGHYYVSVSSLTDLNITVLLVRKELTHLSPFKSYFFNKNGVYQIFTGQKNVLMELFNCVGDFNLIASKNIKDTQSLPKKDSKSITLRRPNYGGHYVVGVQDIFGSYFMAITSKEEKQEVEYLLSYEYYDETNPYDLIDVKNYQVLNSKESEGYRLSVNLPKVVEANSKKLQMKAITVIAHASHSKSDLLRCSRCGIRGKVATKSVDNSSEIFLEKSLIEDLKGSKDDPLYFIIKVKIDAISSPQKNYTLSKLTLIYDLLEVTTVSNKKKYWFTDSLFLLAAWLLLPFLLAAAVLFYLLKFCLRKLMRQQANMVEEEIVAESNPTIPSAAKLAEGGVEPESAKNLTVKEHI